MTHDGIAAKRDPLLQPFKLKSLELRNRVMSTSHACGLHEDGMPGERYQAYHEEKAIGGLALTMFGGSSNIAPDSPSVFEQLYVGDDRIIPFFQSFAARIHARQAALMCQITHLGRRGDPWAGQWLPTIGPSPIRETLHRSFPKEMDRNDIDRVVKAFGDAAWRCKEGGLDGLETIAASHLIGQFLSPLTNRRSDGFGGALENRARFGLMVHDEIRRRVGDDFIVGMRLAIDENDQDGLGFEEAVRVAEMLERVGGVDFFNVNVGMMDTYRALAEDNMPAMHMPSAPWLERAGKFKAAVGKPVLHAAKIADVATARYAISAGLLDMVAMTRAHIADPHIVKKIADGQEDRIRPCVGATHCMSGQRPKCIHNAATGRETVLSHEISRAERSRKTVIIGGGPAGLEAARICALRGHEVVLLEAADRLGGQVLLASTGVRRDLIGVVAWRVEELERLKVDIRFNVLADADDVLAHDPELVIVATGGAPDLAGLYGSELATSTWDVLSGAAKPSGRVLVYDGTGRQAAALTALAASALGAEPSLVTLDGQFGEEMNYAERVGLKKEIFNREIVIETDRRLVSIRRDNNRLLATLVSELTGKDETQIVDYVIVECGVLPMDALFHELSDKSANGGVTDLEQLVIGGAQPPIEGAGFELHRIGDAISSRNIASAITDAFRLCQRA